MIGTGNQPCTVMSSQGYHSPASDEDQPLAKHFNRIVQEIYEPGNTNPVSDPFIAASRAYFRIRQLNGETSTPTVNRERLLHYYALYRLFGSELEKNPFLVHFVATFAAMEKKHRAFALHSGDNLENKIVKSICDFIRLILLQNDAELQKVDFDDNHWPIFPQADQTQSRLIDWAKIDHALQTLQGLSPKYVEEIIALASGVDPVRDYRKQEDVTYTSAAKRSRPVQQLFKSLETMSDPSDRSDQICQLARLQASNSAVDSLNANLGSLNLDERRLLLYEFVLYNLNQPEISSHTVTLLCTFLISLNDKDLLQPMDDYRTLFSSFINWINAVPMARQVYLLS